MSSKFSEKPRISNLQACRNLFAQKTYKERQEQQKALKFK